MCPWCSWGCLWSAARDVLVFRTWRPLTLQVGVGFEGVVTGRGVVSSEEGGSKLAAASQPTDPSSQAVPLQLLGALFGFSPAPLQGTWPLLVQPTLREHGFPCREAGGRVVSD